jgi:hypothetical protein
MLTYGMDGWMQKDDDDDDDDDVNSLKTVEIMLPWYTEK